MRVSGGEMGIRGSMIPGTLQSVQYPFQNYLSKEQGPEHLLIGSCPPDGNCLWESPPPPTHTLSPLNFGAISKCR